MGHNEEYNKANDSLVKGKWYASIANFVAAILFLVAYTHYKDVLFLIAGLILIAAGVGIFIVFQIFGRKLENAYKNSINNIENDK
jgi:ABC-type bacteriocin/lantibiotic exporter with double-glycine peptidase domain